MVYVAGEGLEQHPSLGWIFSSGAEVSRRGLREEAVDALAILRPYLCLILDDKRSGLSFVVVIEVPGEDVRAASAFGMDLQWWR